MVLILAIVFGQDILKVSVTAVYLLYLAIFNFDLFNVNAVPY